MAFNSPREIVTAMKNLFTPLELGHLYLDAGASMVLHGMRRKTGDLDVFIPNEDWFLSIAMRLKVDIQPAQKTGHLCFKVGKDVEAFVVSPVDPKGSYGVAEALSVTDGIRHTTIPLLTKWYEFAIENFGGRQKDIDSLSFIQLRTKMREIVKREEQYAE